MNVNDKIINGINAIREEFPCGSSCEIKDELDYYCDCAILAINKFAEYKELEEQGLLVKLPCKVGDTVYLFDQNDNKVKECFVKSISFINYSWGNGDEILLVTGTDSFRYGLSAFGKVIFPTPEQAELALIKNELEIKL